MGGVGILVLKAAIGGLLVVAFALIGEMVDPKRFAGLFSAAPSVALANLSILLITKGHAVARDAALGMVVGAVAFVAFALANRPLLHKYGALRGSALASVVWFAVAVTGYVAVLR